MWPHDVDVRVWAIVVPLAVLVVWWRELWPS